MITVSAPGKLMLLGEHAVIYGWPCIVTAVDQRLFVSAEKITSSQLEIDAPQVSNTRFVEAAVQQFFSGPGNQYAHQGVRLSAKSEFTSQVGFGSSSAVTVATVGALFELFEIAYTPEDIFRLAFAVSRAVQGGGSGFDIAAAVYGGTLFFRHSGGEIHPFARGVHLVVGYSGEKADTMTLVSQVRQRHEADQGGIDSIFETIGNLVVTGAKALEGSDVVLLGECMNKDQEQLTALGVSTPKLDAMISAARTAGALGAKLSGAGGGDCMIALVQSDTEAAVKTAIEAVGGQVIPVKTHAAGVRLEV